MSEEVTISVCYLSVITQYGYSPLVLAAKKGRTEAVVELVKSGADLNLQTKVCHMLHTTCVMDYTLTVE